MILLNRFRLQVHNHRTFSGLVYILVLSQVTYYKFFFFGKKKKADVGSDHASCRCASKIYVFIVVCSQKSYWSFEESICTLKKGLFLE